MEEGGARPSPTSARGRRVSEGRPREQTGGVGKETPFSNSLSTSDFQPTHQIVSPSHFLAEAVRLFCTKNFGIQNLFTNIKNSRLRVGPIIITMHHFPTKRCACSACGEGVCREGACEERGAPYFD